MLYEAECWATKKRQINKVSTTKICMLRWMSGLTLKDRVRNETIGDLKIAPINDKLR